MSPASKHGTFWMSLTLLLSVAMMATSFTVPAYAEDVVEVVEAVASETSGSTDNETPSEPEKISEQTVEVLGDEAQQINEIEVMDAEVGGVNVMPAEDKPAEQESAAPTLVSQPNTTVAPKVSGRVYVQGKGWLAKQSGKRVRLGVFGKNRKKRQVEAIRLSLPGGLPSGSIAYKVFVPGRGWTAERKDGKAAGTVGKGRRLEAVKIRLTGAMAKSYDVWYRTCVSGIGWLKWASNGKAAGSQGYGKRVWAIQVAIVNKGEGHPSDTSKHKVAFVKGKGIYKAGLKKVSGDVKLDMMLNDFVKKNHIGTGKKGLRKAYDMIAFNYWYSYGSVDPKGPWKSWSIPMAKEMYTNRHGNCYRYAALMCWVARYLGYNAKVVAGHHWRSDHSLASHGWCEVTKNGKKYVIDPIFHHNHPDRNFFMVSYAKTPLEYLLW